MLKEVVRWLIFCKSNLHKRLCNIFITLNNYIMVGRYLLTDDAYKCFELFKHNKSKQSYVVWYLNLGSLKSRAWDKNFDVVIYSGGDPRKAVEEMGREKLKRKKSHTMHYYWNCHFWQRNSNSFQISEIFLWVI